MKRVTLIALACLGLVLGFTTQSAQAQIRFLTLDVYVDAGTKPLAAYQLEISDASSAAKLVGVEGGEHGAFRTPPFHDPRALQTGRVVLAAFSTAKADELPQGRTRVATLHYQVTKEAPPRFEVKLKTAASSNGRKLSVTTTVEERKAP